MPVTRKVFSVKRGWYEEGDNSPQELHYVQPDELPIPLVSHANGKTYTSKAKYIEEHERLGFAVGDRDSKKKNPGENMPPIDPNALIDGFEYGLSVVSDPTKLRAWDNERREKLEKLDKLTLNQPDPKQVNAFIRENMKERRRYMAEKRRAPTRYFT